MRRLTLLLILQVVSACASVPRPPHSPHFEIERFGPGIWLAYAKTGEATGNAAIVDLGDATLVFDAFMSPVAGDHLRVVAESLTSRPAQYIVLSHWHNDHIRGTQSFAGSTIIASTRTRELIAQREPPEIGAEKRNVAGRLERARQRLAGETDAKRLPERRFWVSYYDAMQRSHPILRLTLPIVTFEKELVIHGSARDAHVIDLRGHTGSDSILWLPAERIALMGDLLFVGHHPYLPDGNPDEHRNALRQTLALRPLHLLPGHGPLSGPESAEAMIRYIDDVEEHAAGYVRRGEPEPEVAAVAVPPKYDDWWFGNFYPHNVRFMLRQLRAAAPKQ